MPDPPIRVMLIDPSPVLRIRLGGALRAHSGIEVAAAVRTLAEARRELLIAKPDVILLSLDVDDGDAADFVRALREHYPAPIIAFGQRGRIEAHAAIRALARGAIELHAPIRADDIPNIDVVAAALAEQVETAARQFRPAPVRPRVPAVEPLPYQTGWVRSAEYLIVLGASTGGPAAIEEFLQHSPADSPPIAIVQHMPIGFTGAFAERLARRTRLDVREARHGEALKPGMVRIARGDTHLIVRRRGEVWLAEYGHQRPVNLHCPSVDVLFDSALPTAPSVVGVLLTGMGADGAGGLARLRAAGALTAAQDRASCVVYGMPKAAIESGAAMVVGSPAKLPRRILRELQLRRADTPLETR